MSKAISKEEARKMFLDHAKALASYWSRVESATTKEKLEGLLFSMMVIFDGGSGGFPAVDLVLRPHEEDKQYNIEQGGDWIVDGQVINDDCQLHEMVLV